VDEASGKMKKKVFGRKLSRDRGSRLALYRSLIKALVLHGQIKITYARAKAIQPEVERLVTFAKKGDLASRRLVNKMLANDRKTLDLLFSKIAKQFSSRVSGFTRIVPLAERRGDRAPIVRFEWSQKIVTSDKREVISKDSEEKQTLKARLLKKVGKKDIGKVKKELKSKK